ncbi:hypothetical protein Ahy_A07g031908 isoform C [Arachis hypogaea]|uniref:30S ribosomal protein S13 n=1 Tax=Arachis hypogaea TaxID=3818 RepID=A0A445C5I3_ARAHY|nr:hypothetical protein Ahy_A07g031908 isoform C [Arachis hypogaea]
MELSQHTLLWISLPQQKNEINPLKRQISGVKLRFNSPNLKPKTSFQSHLFPCSQPSQGNIKQTLPYISEISLFTFEFVRGLSIECARVGGVEIPNNKRIEFSLQYIHGIGRSRARKILCDISMDNKVTKDLSEEELITLRDKVSKYVIEGDLRRFNVLNIRRLKEIQCYRG